MAFHRIKKYSRQIVCQDMVLSCQANHIEEIPLFKRAGVTAVSLRNQGAGSSGERFAWVEKDLDLSGMLVNWHLWNSRGVPLPTAPSRTEKTRRTSTEKRGKVCNSSLTLRHQSLYMAIEKFLLFLMPREMTNKRTVHMYNQLCSRQDRVRLSAFYVDTALGFRQYLLENTPSKVLPINEKRVSADKKFASLALLSKRISFPSVKADQISLTFSSQAFLKKACRTTERSYRSTRPTLSLHCPSVLGSPDIQDIAQSGLMTLEGSLTLELS